MNFNLPKLPGYSISHDPSKVDFKRVSSLIMENNRYDDGLRASQSINYISESYDPVKLKIRDDKSKSLSQSVHINHFGSEVTELYQPEWLKFDKKVLRFWAYFKESVEESPIENFRIRKLKLYYYIVDDTIYITEVKETNSGINQGPFLNRGKIRNETGKIINFRDLLVGSNVYIHGRWITLYDCDEFTRKFYSSNGIIQKEKTEVIKDTFHEQKENKPVKIKDNSMNDYLEYKLGGGKTKNMIQFLENDRKVLKFFCLSEKLKYIIHYFLSDDTIEIREVYSGNIGTYPFPLFLKRSKLPKKFSLQQPGSTFGSEFYHASELEQDTTIWAFNRPFKILGCDKFTQTYFQKTYNRSFILLNGFEENSKKVKNDIHIPPYTGYGSEEDISSCLYLSPKPIVKKYYKYFENDRVILRFLAKLDSKLPFDLERKFLISFFLSDDTIQVYEIPSKNSGMTEGKFLERKRYKNPENDNNYFQITDFELNKSMKINSNSFFIFDADDYTKKWLLGNLK